MGVVIRVDFRPSEKNEDEAYRLYCRGSELDEEAATRDEAATFYRRAIALDPTLAVAHTNLGNILFRKGDVAGATRCYEDALRINPEQPEAQYNLGYVELDRGRPRSAAELFEKAVHLDPRFADAYFNLGMAYEQIREPERSTHAFKRYLEIEPRGTWAEIAKKHVRVGERVRSPKLSQKRSRKSTIPKRERPCFTVIDGGASAPAVLPKLSQRKRRAKTESAQLPLLGVDRDLT